MNIQLECFPCLFNQTLESAQLASDDREIIREIIDTYAEMVPEIGEESKTLEVVIEMHDVIEEKTGVSDPYADYKRKNIETSRSLLPEFKKIIAQAEDPLFSALLISAIGNSIDAGVGLEVDIESNLGEISKGVFVRSDYGLFKKKLKKAENILILADNAGEAVFDELLLEELQEIVDITYAVRDRPAINDITMKEADMLNIDNYARVISSGSPTSGTMLDYTSEEFQDYYRKADLRLAKGMGNLEGLYEEDEEIFHLLKAKCGPVSDLIGIDEGELAFFLND
ncbi:damage-control phosphatase ARMT1 family protein [Halarsenatibacter silvermanii]|uniref:Damage-control phosphatase ARMT1-like metal-binding domain-containing protein n=1 Tax=Halarsenatibacter silvermanii TaxID=321763 RepID=A0A1G9J2N7_9FIRM|nr:ARMT1-like domain-containing protein [Halarsenatibacter silvermanii]SDL31582.1 hypothetical protein SAMN04488692_103119 [Halarsenatibacter silvermanii]